MPVTVPAGVLCRESADGEVVDASVVLCARDRNHVVLTTDPDELRRLDPDPAGVRAVDGGQIAVGWRGS